MITHVNAVGFRPHLFTVCLSPVFQSLLKSFGRGPLSPSTSLLARFDAPAKGSAAWGSKVGWAANPFPPPSSFPLWVLVFWFDLRALYIDRSLARSPGFCSHLPPLVDLGLDLAAKLPSFRRTADYSRSDVIFSAFFFSCPSLWHELDKEKTATCWMELGSLDIWRDTFNHCFCGLLLEMNC